MKISGIITEYNPFHLGHNFHLNNCKIDTNPDGVVCVMSGNFVQRGFPSITDKWSRAEMAIKSGVDLVIELPTLFAVSSAEFFSFGAISILDSLNIVDNIYFGSEFGNLDLILTIAKILAFEPNEFKLYLKENLSLGITFPSARANALNTYIENHLDLTIDPTILQDFLNSSNNILGIEYCKILLRLNSSIKPVTLKREGSNYNDVTTEENKFASATAIREFIQNDKSLNSTKALLPNETYNILNSKKDFADSSLMFSYIKYTLLLKPDIANNIKDTNEGLGNKILKEIQTSISLEDLISKCKSKRYTHTRISRVLCLIFLGIDKELQCLLYERPKYIRILGLNQTGAKILKEIKKNSDIEIITKVPKKITDELLKLDIKATNLYSLLNTDLKLNSDYLKSPFILKN